jgi:hypothetical protein
VPDAEGPLRLIVVEGEARMSKRKTSTKLWRRAATHRRVETFQFLGMRLHIAPGLWSYASQYQQAARAVSASPFNVARFYLACHALELALKAFLSTKGLSLERMARRPGHDLATALAEAERLRLADVVRLPPLQRKEVRRARYYGEKVFEYPAWIPSVHGFKDIPDLDLLMGATDRLLRKLREPCLRAGNP